MTKSNIAREQLIKKAQEQIEFCRHTKVTGEGRAHVNQCAALFEIALASIDSEPVAWMVIDIDTGEKIIRCDRSYIEGPCQPLYRHAQQPVVPDEAQWNQVTGRDGFKFTEGWNACRAAMLQAGALTNEDIKFQATKFKPVADLYGITSPTGSETSFTFDAGEASSFAKGGWTVQEYVELERYQEAMTGNSPVIPDGWIPVSERMPEMGEQQCYVLAADFKNNYFPNTPNTQVGVYGDWFNDGNPTWDDGDGEDLHLKEVTHWMPLPNPPKEVTSARVHPARNE